MMYLTTNGNKFALAIDFLAGVEFPYDLVILMD
jgi:hypothetical protein